MKHEISVRNVLKRFGKGEGVVALANVSFEVEAGEFVVLLGPSGCGKTTLLRCVAGLEQPDSGEILIGGRPVFSLEQGIFLPPEQRQISMVFQSYALWPHKSVYDNVAYPLQARRVAKTEQASRVHDALKLVSCHNLADRFPSQLSGGQQQRIALARALVADSKVVLFDEPLSNIDAKLREQLRLDLIDLHHRLGFTALYVTHDQAEAMNLASRIAVMNVGTISQMGSPTSIHDRPESLYVADFVGKMNFYQGVVGGQRGDEIEVDTVLGKVVATLCGGKTFASGARVTVGFRPAHARIEPVKPNTQNCWNCTLLHSSFLGTYNEHVLTSAGARVVITDTSQQELAADKEVWVTAPSNRVYIFAELL